MGEIVQQPRLLGKGRGLDDIRGVIDGKGLPDSFFVEAQSEQAVAFLLYSKPLS